MDSYWERLRSFSNWNNNNEVWPTYLARTGFYYVADQSVVQCYACNLLIANTEWRRGQNPAQVHREQNPDCPHVIDTSNTGPIDSPSNLIFLDPPIPDTRDQLQQTAPPRRQTRTRRDRHDVPPNQSNQIQIHAFPDKADEAKQLKTFQHWPAEQIIQGKILAKVGLFYEGDRVCARCFHCRIVLRSWEVGQDPLVEHVKRSPYCQYAKGLQIVDRGVTELEGASSEEEENELPERVTENSQLETHENLDDQTFYSEGEPEDGKSGKRNKNESNKEKSGTTRKGNDTTSRKADKFTGSGRDQGGVTSGGSGDDGGNGGGKRPGNGGASGGKNKDEEDDEDGDDDDDNDDDGAKVVAETKPKSITAKNQQEETTVRKAANKLQRPQNGSQPSHNQGGVVSSSEARQQQDEPQSKARAISSALTNSQGSEAIPFVRDVLKKPKATQQTYTHQTRHPEVLENLAIRKKHTSGETTNESTQQDGDENKSDSSPDLPTYHTETKGSTTQDGVHQSSSQDVDNRGGSDCKGNGEREDSALGSQDNKSKRHRTKQEKKKAKKKNKNENLEKRQVEQKEKPGATSGAQYSSPNTKEATTTQLNHSSATDSSGEATKSIQQVQDNKKNDLGHELLNKYDIKTKEQGVFASKNKHFISQAENEHCVQRHTIIGTKTSQASKFASDVNLQELKQSTMYEADKTTMHQKDNKKLLFKKFDRDVGHTTCGSPCRWVKMVMKVKVAKAAETKTCVTPIIVQENNGQVVQGYKTSETVHEGDLISVEIFETMHPITHPNGVSAAMNKSVQKKRNRKRNRKENDTGGSRISRTGGRQPYCCPKFSGTSAKTA